MNWFIHVVETVAHIERLDEASGAEKTTTPILVDREFSDLF